MQAGDGGDQGQAKAAAGRRAAALQAIEAIEDPRPFGFGHARPVVGHRDQGLSAVGGDLDHHMGLRAGMAQGVLDQIGQHLGQQLRIAVDQELLTQMLANLVENALRHAGPRAHAVVRVAAAGPEAVISVTDDGPGVPEAERERIFDRFYRLERSRSSPGSGLGLALAAAVARLHEAAVTLEDAGPGLGVRIAFRLRARPTLGIPNVADSAPSSAKA